MTDHDLALPDGTHLIVNGAKEGVAGFGLANDPNLNALLYDSTQPVGQRISILNDTIVARLYHSEATVRLPAALGLLTCLIAVLASLRRASADFRK